MTVVSLPFFLAGESLAALAILYWVGAMRGRKLWLAWVGFVLVNAILSLAG